MVENSPYPLAPALAVPLAGILGMNVALALWLQSNFGLSALAPALSALTLIGTLALSEPVRRIHGPTRLGPADAVTLFRSLWVGAAACFIDTDPTPTTATLVMGITAIALALDGLDGLVARRTQTSSIFGAQLDMELDAALMMVLSALVWTWGQAGPWVLTAGLLRYVWVGSTRFLPWMRRPLPPWKWRKTACVIATAGLLFALGPWMPVPLAATATGVLWLSFGADFVWLFQRRTEGIE